MLKTCSRGGWMAGIVLAGCTMATTIAGSSAPGADWPRWGGPAANFNVQSGSLAEKWPADGPPLLWQRTLGGGYSAVVSDGKRLYTMHRTPMVKLFATKEYPDAPLEGQEDAVLPSAVTNAREVIIALDPDTGSTVWEHGYEAPITPSHHGPDLSYGRGPNSTPMLAGGFIYTLGYTGVMHCLQADSGKVVWSHDLAKEYNVDLPYFGHAASPIRYQDTVIVLAGGVMAFDLTTGDLQWANRDVEASYASPLIMRVDDRDLLVTPLAGEIAGLDPANGRILWRHPHANQYNTILSTPIILDDNSIFVSAAWVGSRLLKVSWADDDWKVQEIWHNKRMQVAHSNAVQVGDLIYASSGVEINFLSAINIKTGEVSWKQRGFAMANLLHADGKFIVLDEDGTLGLAHMTAEGAKVHEKVQALNQRSWTVPTLLDTRLFIRSRGSIRALQLGVPSQAGVAKVPSQRSAR
ncbi:MAG: PQQ-like beta-propeller repeat protein [Acidobacteria bacterium]|nr:PQQ-like beta-propeller repeat protein [Acidobacteriota bacterium]